MTGRLCFQVSTLLDGRTDAALLGYGKYPSLNAADLFVTPSGVFLSATPKADLCNFVNSPISLNVEFTPDILDFGLKVQEHR